MQFTENGLTLKCLHISPQWVKPSNHYYNEHNTISSSIYFSDQKENSKIELSTFHFNRTGIFSTIKMECRPFGGAATRFSNDKQGNH